MLLPFKVLQGDAVSQDAQELLERRCLFVVAKQFFLRRLAETHGKPATRANVFSIFTITSNTQQGHKVKLGQSFRPTLTFTEQWIFQTRQISSKQAQLKFQIKRKKSSKWLKMKKKGLGKCLKPPDLNITFNSITTVTIFHRLVIY